MAKRGRGSISTASPSRCERCGELHESDTGDRNCRAVFIGKTDGPAVLRMAQSNEGVGALAAAGVPAALLGSLVQTREVPSAWATSPAWTRGVQGVQGYLPRLDLPQGAVSALVRAGDPEWAGQKQSGRAVPVGLFASHPDEAGEGETLAAVVCAWLEELPINVAGLSALAMIVEVAGLGERKPADLRVNPILPVSLAAGKLAREPNTLALFGVGREQPGPAWLPGLERDPGGPCLPLALYDLAGGDRGSRGPAADLALRMFVESVLSAPLGSEQPVALQIPLRAWLDWFYGGSTRQPRPNEYWPLLNRAARALDRHEARVPWTDASGRGALRRVVQMGDIPRGPGRLDDLVSVVVWLPPGSNRGPVVNRERLREWGRRSAPAYRAMLGLAYRWFQPGVTRVPAGRGRHWLQVRDPERYEPVSDAQAVGLCYPTGQYGRRRRVVEESWRILRKLAAAKDALIVGKRVLPGPPGDESE